MVFLSPLVSLFQGLGLNYLGVSFQGMMSLHSVVFSFPIFYSEILSAFVQGVKSVNSLRVCVLLRFES